MRRSTAGRAIRFFVALATLLLIPAFLTGCADSSASRTETAAVAPPAPTETLTPGGEVLRIDGQVVRDVFVPDANRAALYAMTDQRLYIRTTEGWQATNTVADDRKLLVNPAVPEQLLRGNHPPCRISSDLDIAFEVSQDSGNTWRKLLNAVNIRPDAFDPELPEIVFGSNCRLELSLDGGLTWDEVPGAPFNAIVQQLPYDTHLLVLDQVSEQMRQIRSVDLNAVDDPQFSDVLLEAPDLSCIAADGERIVAGGLGGVYISTDGGANWSHSRVGLESVTLDTETEPLPRPAERPENVGVLTVSLDPEHHSWIFAGAAQGLYVSQDDGATWAIYDAVARDARVVALQPANDGADLYVTTDQGVVLVPHP